MEIWAAGHVPRTSWRCFLGGVTKFSGVDLGVTAGRGGIDLRGNPHFALGVYSGESWSLRYLQLVILKPTWFGVGAYEFGAPPGE